MVAILVSLVIALILVVKKGPIHLPKSWLAMRCLTPALFALAWASYFVEVRLVEDASTNTVRLALDGFFLVTLGALGLTTVLLSLWAKRRLVASMALKSDESTREQKAPMQLLGIKIMEIAPRGTGSVELKSILREPESMPDIHRTVSESSLVVSNGKDDESEDVMSAKSADDADGTKTLSKDIHAMSPLTSTSAAPSSGSIATSSDSISSTG